jgi:hypothetical protein
MAEEKEELYKKLAEIAGELFESFRSQGFSPAQCTLFTAAVLGRGRTETFFIDTGLIPDIEVPSSTKH